MVNEIVSNGTFVIVKVGEWAYHDAKIVGYDIHPLFDRDMWENEGFYIIESWDQAGNYNIGRYCRVEFDINPEQNDYMTWAQVDFEKMEDMKTWTGEDAVGTFARVLSNDFVGCVEEYNESQDVYIIGSNTDPNDKTVYIVNRNEFEIIEE